MRVRSLLTLTALVSSILGATAVYLVLSVPNDLKADALLKTAREDLAAGRTAEAHDGLTQVVQQYPRTDAAAAAIVALVKIGEQQRTKLEGEIRKLRDETRRQKSALSQVETSVETIRKTPPPAPLPPAVTAVPESAPKSVVKKPAARKPTPKKAPPRKKTTRRRSR